MSTIEKLEELFDKEYLKENRDIDKLTELATLIKTISENEKAQEESKKLKEETLLAQKQLKSKSQVYISLLAPILTAVTLLLTLYQFNKNNEQQRIANEDTQWRDFTKQLQNREAINNNLTITPTLVSFLKSERFSNQARELLFTLLPGSVKSDEFEYLFSQVSSSIDHKTFGRVSNLSRSLTDNFNHWKDEVQKDSSQLTDTSRAIIATAKINLDKHLFFKKEVDKELAIVSTAIIKFLTEGNKPSDYILTLKGVSFFKNDLSNVDFSKAEIFDAVFESCDVTSANFKDVVNFENSSWIKTAWWRASNLSDQLTEYLITYFPYNSGMDYFNTNSEDSTKYARLMENFNKKHRK